MRKSKQQESDQNISPSGRSEVRSTPNRKRIVGRTDADDQLTLFFLRHGEAGARMTNSSKDADRALTPNGRKEMVGIAKGLRKSGVTAERIVTSPFRRARETAEIVAQFLKIPLPDKWDELRPDGNRESLYRKLARIENGSRVILVGHEPYLTSIIGEIVGAPAARLVLKKGGLAKVRITTRSPRLGGELRWLLTPKMISRMA